MTENIPMFSAWQFLSASKRRLLSTFGDIGRGFQFYGSPDARVAILALSNAKIKMRLSLQYSVVVGMNMQIFGVYVCFNESILSPTLDPEGKIFFRFYCYNFIHNIYSDF